VLVLFRLRSRSVSAPFRVPLYPAVPIAFLSVYALLLAGSLWQQPLQTGLALAVLLATALVARGVVRPQAAG